jgi:hypothetical protein
MKKRLLKETGIRNIGQLSKRYPKAEIYFHMDLDGVTTAIAMKKYLEDNGIKVVGAHVIQYGDKEFAVKKNDALGDTMPVLVDFAHGKPMFVIHTDHHLGQVGVEKGTSTQFRGARSNVETMSQVVSPRDVFPNSDILLISTVDSADFKRFGLTVDDVLKYLFTIDTNQSLQRNKMAMGLVTNKLLLAFKNKPGFLEELVMKSSPSLLNILQNIKRIIEEKGYAKPDEMIKHQQNYIKQMQTSPNVKYENGIIVQYGGGSMTKPGSYDRYTPFKNNPDADFLVIAWPMGLVQASCNPFKPDRELKGVHLGEIAMQVLSKWESQLKERIVPLSTIKWISETAIKEGSVGFTFKDAMAIFGKKIESIEGGENILDRVEQLMEKPTPSLTEDEWKVLDRVGITAWDIIVSNSGGHKCITNISGLNYFGRGKRPPKGKYKYDPESEDSPYVKFTKMVQNEFVRMLKELVNQ